MRTLGHFWRRNTITIAVVIVIIAFGTILFLQALATSQIENTQTTDAQILNQMKSVVAELDNNTKQLGVNAQQRSAQINTLTQRLNCIFFFFSSQNPDRAQKAIDDINTCTISSITSSSGSGATISPGPSFATTMPAPSSNAPSTSTSPSNSAPAKPSNPPTTTPASGGSPAPGFFQRLIQPIKNIINGL